MGYGKAWESMYTGSMVGKGTDVFAVWGYVISTMRVTNLEAFVELNPDLLAFQLGASVEEMEQAIVFLSAPDPKSRTKDHDGRRLVPIDPELTGGPQQYLVVNGYKYRYTKDEQEKRAKNRDRQRVFRAKKNKAPRKKTPEELDAAAEVCPHGNPWEACLAGCAVPGDTHEERWANVARKDAEYKEQQDHIDEVIANPRKPIPEEVTPTKGLCPHGARYGMRCGECAMQVLSERGS